ncbi:type 1 glutamine amidotransferase [Halorhabdus sp. BNX81]|uniref:type 1 glutamine amidotransferase n=1 Tax=Halorhabdus sp. BNX81 TaxID=2980181 RepID=UPI0023DD50DB|nr:type 1 glutamine amidotransferase [Halorhabdus sp. BNX81]WEL20647.1 GMP synthase - Glutamine amidotransferase domain [Halorhabdus sp. BNX81]
MHVQYLQHVPHEGPGRIAEWARDRGHTIEGAHLYDGDSLPEPAEFDWLVVMGGPMSVHDTEAHPWLAKEKRLIAEAIAAGKTVLGICLGGQLLAQVLGAEVREHDRREIGWYPIEATDRARDWPPTADLPDRFPVFHWHGDTFAIPDEADRLYGSEACVNQAFVSEDRVVGFQCHPEATAESIAALIEATEVDPGPSVQDPETLLPAADRLEDLRSYCYTLLDGLAEQCSSPPGSATNPGSDREIDGPGR